MNGKENIKIGISIGVIKGQRMFSIPVEHPAHSFHRANEIIHENFDPDFSLYFVDKSNQRRRSRRR